MKKQPLLLMLAASTMLLGSGWTCLLANSLPWIWSLAQKGIALGAKSFET
jgi:hypothetical protein